MRAIFISYRREDTEGQARALFQDLVAKLGKESVFMDVDSIALGRDFRQVLQERLASCDLMLVLIGKDWVDAKDQSGRRRLDNPGDFVRLEIAAALKRNIPVTPLLLQGAQMPTAEQLPEELSDLAYRNGFELSHNRWESDVQELIKRAGLDKRGDVPVENKTDGWAVAPQPDKKRWFTIAGVSVVAIAIAAGGFLYYENVVKENNRDGKGVTRPVFEEGKFHVVVASTTSESSAISQSEQLRKKGYASEAYLTPSGSYAVTVGSGSQEEATRLKTKAIQAGVTKESDKIFLSQGKTWLKKVFP